MNRKFCRSVISFLLVFVLTVLVVGTLSRATTAEAETAPARYSEDLRKSRGEPAEEELAEEKTALSAPVAAASPVGSAGAFVLVLAVGGAGFAVFLVSQRGAKNRPARSGRGYSPRADMCSRRAASGARG